MLGRLAEKVDGAGGARYLSEAHTREAEATPPGPISLSMANPGVRTACQKRTKVRQATKIPGNGALCPVKGPHFWTNPAIFGFMISLFSGSGSHKGDGGPEQTLPPQVLHPSHLMLCSPFPQQAPSCYGEWAQLLSLDPLHSLQGSV